MAVLDTLTPSELAAVTSRKRTAAQAAALARRGVPFRFEGRRVLVERAVASAHGLLSDVPAPQQSGINFAAVR